MRDMYPGAITDVGGLSVGHAQDAEALTGCTVLLCPQGLRAGGVVRGLAPGTRETDLLRPGTLVERVHAILLTGGSAYGLAAADGVMRYLEERGAGYDAGAARVPIVPSAVLFDLGLGAATVRPDAAMGYAACLSASAAPPHQGNVGAGTGASVGKLMGMGQATKGGIGTASLRAGRLCVGALVAVNAFGDVVDLETQAILAGCRRREGTGWLNTSEALRGPVVRNALAFGHTVIGVVATNAKLDVAALGNLASAAHDGLARAVRPAHTLYDGDAFFAVCTDRIKAHPLLVNDLANEVMARAIVNAVLAAEPLGGLPCARSWNTK
jgi:L-aminopeptidase/D-esterase-like protein